jgi:hypothetical protein
MVKQNVLPILPFPIVTKYLFAFSVPGRSFFQTAVSAVISRLYSRTLVYVKHFLKSFFIFLLIIFIGFEADKTFSSKK